MSVRFRTYEGSYWTHERISRRRHSGKRIGNDSGFDSSRLASRVRELDWLIALNHLGEFRAEGTREEIMKIISAPFNNSRLGSLTGWSTQREGGVSPESCSSYSLFRKPADRESFAPGSEPAKVYPLSPKFYTILLGPDPYSSLGVFLNISKAFPELLDQKERVPTEIQNINPDKPEGINSQSLEDNGLASRPTQEPSIAQVPVIVTTSAYPEAHDPLVAKSTVIAPAEHESYPLQDKTSLPAMTYTDSRGYELRVTIPRHIDYELTPAEVSNRESRSWYEDSKIKKDWWGLYICNQYLKGWRETKTNPVKHTTLFFQEDRFVFGIPERYDQTKDIPNTWRGEYVSPGRRDMEDTVTLYSGTSNLSKLDEPALAFTLILDYLLHEGIGLKPERFNYRILLDRILASDQVLFTSEFYSDLSYMVKGKPNPHEVDNYVRHYYSNRSAVDLFTSCVATQMEFWRTIEGYPESFRDRNAPLVSSLTARLETYALSLTALRTELEPDDLEDFSDRFMSDSHLFRLRQPWTDSSTILIVNLDAQAPFNSDNSFNEEELTTLRLEFYNQTEESKDDLPFDLTNLPEDVKRVVVSYDLRDERDPIDLLWDQYMAYRYVLDYATPSTSWGYRAFEECWLPASDSRNTTAQCLHLLTAGSSLLYYGLDDAWRKWYEERYLVKFIQNQRVKQTDWQTGIDRIRALQLESEEALKPRQEAELRELRLRQEIDKSRHPKDPAFLYSKYAILREQLSTLVGEDSRLGTRGADLDLYYRNLINRVEFEGNVNAYLNSVNDLVVVDDRWLSLVFYQNMSVQWCLKTLDQHPSVTPHILAQGFQYSMINSFAPTIRNPNPQDHGAEKFTEQIQEMYRRSKWFHFRIENTEPEDDPSDKECGESANKVDVADQIFQSWQGPDRKEKHLLINRTDYNRDNGYGFDERRWEGAFETLMDRLRQASTDVEVSKSKSNLIKCFAYVCFRHSMIAHASHVAGKCVEERIDVSPTIFKSLSERVRPDGLLDAVSEKFDVDHAPGPRLTWDKVSTMISSMGEAQKWLDERLPAHKKDYGLSGLPVYEPVYSWGETLQTIRGSDDSGLRVSHGMGEYEIYNQQVAEPMYEDAPQLADF